MLHTKYESSGLFGFGEEDIYVVPIVSLWELMTPGAGSFLTPGSWLAGLLNLLNAELTKCYEPLQKLRVRLGSCKTGLSPPVTLCY